MDLGFKSNPSMHRGPEVGPFRVRIEAGQMWVAPARIFWKDFERRESMYVLWTAIPNPKTGRWGRTGMPARQKTKANLIH
jgi:hypothetical protein